ncbi:MAG: septal ring lytic transglycosylase RlpA family protein [Desulfohalobiaceae bacterium]|nr:septal ring lytic transglycosylase RlpA family protein [Desulfohalobiaceae bacterium]
MALVLPGCGHQPQPREGLREGRAEPLSRHRLRGIASWYGGKFHGRKTANGETYDMHGLTAAHKTLPFGLRVRVGNLDNGRTVVVRINDRGPFVKDRVIDLSYAAARRMGMVRSGTARVTITPLSRPGPAAREAYCVQVGAFASRDNAGRVLEELRRLGTGARLVRLSRKGQTLWRVRSKNYSSLEEARLSLRVLLRKYPDSFIVAD